METTPQENQSLRFGDAPPTALWFGSSVHFVVFFPQNRSGRLWKFEVSDQRLEKRKKIHDTGLNISVLLMLRHLSIYLSVYRYTHTVSSIAMFLFFYPGFYILSNKYLFQPYFFLRVCCAACEQ